MHTVSIGGIAIVQIAIPESLSDEYAKNAVITLGCRKTI